MTKSHPKNCPIPDSCVAGVLSLIQGPPTHGVAKPTWWCPKCGEMGMADMEPEVAGKPEQSAASILREAAHMVAGNRNITHGEKEPSFVAIAFAWNAYLKNRRVPNGPIRPHDVSQMMVLLKMCRAEWGTPVRDHFTDQCGYGAIAGEIVMGEQNG